MRFAQQMIRMIGGTAVVGALVLSAAPTASADDTRDKQWQNKAYNIDAVHKEATGKDVTVAILDNGVDGDQADLTGNVLPGKRCSDDQPANKETKDSLGTNLAALIAGHGHGAGNGDGILGIAPDAKILPVDIYVRDGIIAGHHHTEACDADEAIRYAVDQGADVIDISQSPEDNKKVRQAVAYALAHDVVLVQNAADDNEEEPKGLANVPGVALVGGSTPDGSVWRDKDHGSNTSESLMFTAPAKTIKVANPDGSYETIKGNVSAGAIAAGAFALLKEKFPDHTPGQLINRVIKSTYIAKGVDKSRLPDAEHGYGDLSPHKALTQDIAKGRESGPWDPSELPKLSTADKATDSGSDTVLYAGIAGGAVVVLAIVLIVVLSSRKKNRGGPGGPGGPGAPGSGGQPSFPAQQPYPGQPQPYPVQQPYPSQQPYPGQQAYPGQQQPYPGPYQQTPPMPGAYPQTPPQPPYGQQ
ncbi:S8 family peptidase [Streptomyces sp. cg35]|uniref:S8 family peptidase n=1 Tax=Streptomyces sp. cg35 TaxID=3421650 RepID=UPI003D17C357